VSSVRLAAVDGPDGRGGWRPEIDTRLALLDSPVGALLERHRESFLDADRVVLAPDAHYPFHPSTGTVTDPAVVGAIAAWFDRETDAALTIVGRSDDRIEFGRTGSYLGYSELCARFDAELVDLAADDVAHRNQYRGVDGRSVALGVPEPLLESTVITVPTLRPTRDGPLAGSIRRLGALVHSNAEPARVAVAATRAVEPALAVLDATVAYGDGPVAANALLAGSAAAVDAVGTSLLDRDPEADDALAAVLAERDEPTTVTPAPDVDLDSIRTRLAGGRLPPAGDTHPAVSAAYRVYAAASGDVVPPQLESR
jgi:uncharacterized protein (DUF362 family)